ncbi:MAG: hypothetical protein ACOC93_06470 [Planctomycetota bacterium]
MAETIESFVAKLQEEGVQAGQQQAEQMRADAERQAEEILAQAREEAEKIRADARADADSSVARSRTEMQLAARDTILQLRQSLSQVLQAVLTAGAREKLGDEQFLGKVLHEIVLAYSRADIDGSREIEINVPGEMRDQLADWALAEINQDRRTRHMSIDLKGTLRQSGFEYTVSGGTVEVTLDSVVERLCEMVTPRLREIIQQAAKQDQGE